MVTTVDQREVTLISRGAALALGLSIPKADDSMPRPMVLPALKAHVLVSLGTFLVSAQSTSHDLDRPVGMPKLFIDNQGSDDDTQYAFMDAAGNPQFATRTADHGDGCTSTDIYEYELVGAVSQEHLVATIKWPASSFHDPVLVVYPHHQSENTTQLQLSTNHMRQ